MLFNNYKKILYTIGNREVELRDIFTRVTFLNDYTSERAYDYYYIQEGEDPEDVARSVYGNEYYSWLVLMTNNIISEDEWYSGDNVFLERLNTKYSGEAYYITNLPDLKPGDLMVKVTQNSPYGVIAIDEDFYRIVTDFDKTFRSVWGHGGSGEFLIGDKIMFARQNVNGSATKLNFISSSDITNTTEYTDIKFIESKKNSPIHFKTINSDLVIPPNVVYVSPAITSDSISKDTIHTDDFDLTGENFARTLLYSYMTNTGRVTGVEKLSYYDYELNKYRGSQKLRILKPEYCGPALTLMEQLLTSNSIGKRISIGF